MEDKKNDTLREDARIVPQTAPAPAILPDLPEQELPEDIPAEVKEKLKADLAETKPFQRMMNGASGGIENAGLERDGDSGFHGGSLCAACAKNGRAREKCRTTHRISRC